MAWVLTDAATADETNNTAARKKGVSSSAAWLRACFRTPVPRRVRARALQDWAAKLAACRPGALTGRVLRHALMLLPILVATLLAVSTARTARHSLADFLSAPLPNPPGKCHKHAEPRTEVEPKQGTTLNHEFRHQTVAVRWSGRRAWRRHGRCGLRAISRLRPGSIRLWERIRPCRAVRRIFVRLRSLTKQGVEPGPGFPKETGIESNARREPDR